MTDTIAIETANAPAAREWGNILPLAQAKVGWRGTIVRVGADLPRASTLEAEELERRLLELGFVEGAQVEILHEGVIGGDPIAVKLDDMRVAIRRREAFAIEVRYDLGTAL